VALIGFLFLVTVLQARAKLCQDLLVDAEDTVLVMSWKWHERLLCFQVYWDKQIITRSVHSRPVPIFNCRNAWVCWKHKDIKSLTFERIILPPISAGSLLTLLTHCTSFFSLTLFLPSLPLCLSACPFPSFWFCVQTFSFSFPVSTGLAFPPFLA